MSALERRPWLLLAAFSVAMALWQSAGAWPDPTRTAALSPYSEALGHFWGLHAAAAGLFDDGPLVRDHAVDWPSGLRIHLIDPVNELVFAPLYWAAGGGIHGATLAWNGLHALAPLVAGTGIWALVRRKAAGPALPFAALLAGVVFISSPFFLLYYRHGRTEYLPAVLVPLHLAWLGDWLSAEGQRPAWKAGLGAGLTLGAIALAGGYLAVFAGLGSVMAGLLWAPWRRPGLAVARLALVASLALLCALPAAQALAEAPPAGLLLAGDIWSHNPNLHASPQPVAAVFRLGPRLGGALDHPPYVGLVALLLAFVAAIRERHGRFWLCATLALLVLAVGPTLDLGREGRAEDQPRMPLWLLLRALPPLQRIHGWSRLMVVASAFAAMGAAIGLASLWPRLGRLAPAVGLSLCGLALFDQATWPAVTPFPPRFAPAPPEPLFSAISALPPGAIIALPLDTRLSLGTASSPSGEGEEHALWLSWQLALGRPISTGFNGIVDHYADTALGRAVLRVEDLCARERHDRCRVSDVRAGGLRLLPEQLSPASVSHDLQKLRDDGYAGLVLVEEMEAGGELRAPLTSLLGPPLFDRGGVLAWSVR